MSLNLPYIETIIYTTFPGSWIFNKLKINFKSRGEGLSDFPPPVLLITLC
jgi:hypothetical protein